MKIVIQGAGRGIGLALAQRAVKAGASDLFLTARHPEASTGFAALPPCSSGTAGPRISWYSVDATKPETCETTGKQIIDQAGKLDRVICTAGVLQDDHTRPEKRLADIDSAAMLYSYQVNALGPALMIRALWPALRGDHPVKIASISARVGSIADNKLGGWYGYRASKAAQNQLIRTLSVELARLNPQSCAVTLHPGTVDTGLSKPFQGNVPADKLFSPAYSADCLWNVMDGLTPVHTGGFFAYDASPIAF